MAKVYENEEGGFDVFALGDVIAQFDRREDAEAFAASWNAENA